MIPLVPSALRACHLCGEKRKVSSDFSERRAEQHGDSGRDAPFAAVVDNVENLALGE